MPEDTDKSVSDILEWLSTIFGFQVFDSIGCFLWSPGSLFEYVTEPTQLRGTLVSTFKELKDLTSKAGGSVIVARHLILLGHVESIALGWLVL